MRFIFKFPDIGEGISEGKILEWYVKKGQRVQSGEHLVKMETDKVVADIPSPKSGTIAVCFGNVGDIVYVEDPLVEIEIENVSPQEAQKIAEEKPAPPKQESLEEKGFGVVGTLEVAGEGAYLPASYEGRMQEENDKKHAKKVLATPVARAMAKELGVDINHVKGSGPQNRVTKKDIEEHFSRKEKPAPIEKSEVIIEAKELIEAVEISQVRKSIARRMTISKQTAPHMSIFEEVEISQLVSIREEHKEIFAKKGIKLTYLPFIIKAVVQALIRHKALNSSFDIEKGQILYKHYYNIGIAVDAPDGLVVPVIRNADTLSIFAMAQAIGEITEKARSRKLTLDDMKDSTFTITNYGSIAGLYAVPIINYPEVAILGVGRIHQKPIVKKGQMCVGNILPLSMSVDHRAVDGGETSRFLQEIIDGLTNPVSLLLS
ncbi:MAG: 2-oxo acid dehydrogenase subunit E2 [Candidatus Brocadiae bacterium]|nr:2-oxo acid dehydrogenase subunit E2 [Candidatus Brocadiia bacterium]